MPAARRDGDGMGRPPRRVTIAAMNAMRSDVLVLGGGVIGLSCALALLRQGASVRVLERGDPGSGASHGNCGTLTPSHAIPLTVPGMPWKALHWMLRRDAPLYVSPKPDWQRWRWLLGFANHCNLAFAERAAIARAAILQRSWTLLPRLLVEEGIECEYAPSGSLFVHRDARMLEAILASALQLLGEFVGLFDLGGTAALGLGRPFFALGVEEPAVLLEEAAFVVIEDGAENTALIQIRHVRVPAGPWKSIGPWDRSGSPWRCLPSNWWRPGSRRRRSRRCRCRSRCGCRAWACCRGRRSGRH